MPYDTQNLPGKIAQLFVVLVSLYHLSGTQVLPQHSPALKLIPQRDWTLFEGRYELETGNRNNTDSMPRGNFMRDIVNP